MTQKEISSGVVHDIPKDFKEMLLADDDALGCWEEITPLARNEWICWILDAKKTETRQRRIVRALAELKEGKRRPCCWPGCAHREKSGY